MDKQTALRRLEKIGESLGFKVEREWSPESLKGVSKQLKYIPRIDLIWYKPMPETFINFLLKFIDQGVLDPYRDYKKEVIIGFEIEATDRPTKYIIGDISNLSRLCDYGFIVIRNVENLVERAKKASRAFSTLHGASNVFIIDLDEIDDLIKWVKKSNF